MRITNSLLYSQQLSQLQQQYQQVAIASTQVSSGQRNANVSDDPAAAATVLKTDAATRANTQYRRNITSAQASLTSEESTLDQVTDIMNRVKEIATEQGSANSGTTSAAAAAEVQQLIDQVISMGNLKIGDQFVFGGTNTGSPPFAADGTYSGNNVSSQTEISQGNMMPTVDSGQQIFVDSGVLSSMQSLETALQGGDQTAIRNTISGLDSAFDQTQTTLAGVGARTNTLSSATDALTSQATSLAATRSAAADIPIEEATLSLATMQNSLQAGLLATSRILSTSLVNYLGTT
ncbi:MAG TPA: flagellar hook-associated protein FlgL [Gemmatimonadales bacterium]|jgi:flagellar hook-associated protein 3 FlgL